MGDIGEPSNGTWRRVATVPPLLQAGEIEIHRRGENGLFLEVEQFRGRRRPIAVRFELEAGNVHRMGESEDGRSVCRSEGTLRRGDVRQHGRPGFQQREGPGRRRGGEGIPRKVERAFQRQEQRAARLVAVARCIVERARKREA